MAIRPKKLPSDVNQRANYIGKIATGEITEKPNEKNPAAVALGRLGGLVGGKARAKKLSATKRKQIAKKAANARWGKKKPAKNVDKEMKKFVKEFARKYPKTTTKLARE